MSIEQRVTRAVSATLYNSAIAKRRGAKKRLSSGRRYEARRGALLAQVMLCDAALRGVDARDAVL